MQLSFFLLGAFGWWCLTILFVFYVFLCIEKEINLFWPILALVIYVLFSQFIAGADIVNFAVKHPMQMLLYILGYFVTGFIWSFIKWWLHVNSIADKYKERKRKYEALKEPKTESNFQSWERKNYSYKNLEKPKVSQSKKKITLWIMYWPISMIWSLLDDFVKKTIQHLVIKFQKLYQSIVDRAFRGIDTNE